MLTTVISCHYALLEQGQVYRYLTMHTSASSVQFTRFQTPNQQMIRMQTTVIGKLLQYKLFYPRETKEHLIQQALKFYN